MRPTLTALALILAFVSPAAALPTAHGTFGFVPFGAVTTNTANQITETTTAFGYPANVVVNTAPATFQGVSSNLGISVGDTVTLSTPTFSFAAGLGSMAVDIDVMVGGLTFNLDAVETITRNAGPNPAWSRFIDLVYDGTLKDGGGLFAEGAPITIAMSCNQAGAGAAINCSDTVAVVGTAVPEPASLALLGMSLLGLAGVIKLKQGAEGALG